MTDVNTEQDKSAEADGRVEGLVMPQTYSIELQGPADMVAVKSTGKLDLSYLMGAPDTYLYPCDLFIVDGVMMRFGAHDKNELLLSEWQLMIEA